MAVLVTAIHAKLPSVQLLIKVTPIRIEIQDQVDLPGARPMLHVAFFLNGIANVFETFVPD
jgi:hypothetical protein